MKTSFRLKNDHDELPGLKAQIQGLGQQHGLPAKLIHDLCLAVEEVVTNIIKYGYTDSLVHEIQVDLIVSPDEIQLTIIDDARAFNPLDHPTPDLEKSVEELKVGGLGIYLLRQLLMDDLEYRRDSGQNILLMRKKLDPSND